MSILLVFGLQLAKSWIWHLRTECSWHINTLATSFIPCPYRKNNVEDIFSPSILLLCQQLIVLFEFKSVWLMMALTVPRSKPGFNRNVMQRMENDSSGEELFLLCSGRRRLGLVHRINKRCVPNLVNIITIKDLECDDKRFQT